MATVPSNQLCFGMYHFYIISWEYQCIYNKWHNIPRIRLLNMYTKQTCNRAMLLEDFGYVSE